VKRIFWVLFCVAASIQAAPIIFDEPVRVSGDGMAWLEDPRGLGIQNGGLNIAFGGFISADAFVSVFYERGDSAPALGLIGGILPGGLQSVSFARIDTFSSPYFTYVLGTGESKLTLWDAAMNEIASVPLIGYFDANVTEYVSYPNGGYLQRYQITILPTPEPAAWLLIGTALPAIWCSRRLSQRLPLARR
jgi:hypothetical protein